eukprot:jgi/Botrbrau1/10755/Bobra.180_2s0020.1
MQHMSISSNLMLSAEFDAPRSARYTSLTPRVAFRNLQVVSAKAASQSSKKKQKRKDSASQGNYTRVREDTPESRTTVPVAQETPLSVLEKDRQKDELPPQRVSEFSRVDAYNAKEETTSSLDERGDSHQSVSRQTGTRAASAQEPPGGPASADRRQAPAGSGGGSPKGAAPLPAADRGQVLQACTISCAGLVAAGLGLRSLAILTGWGGFSGEPEPALSLLSWSGQGGLPDLAVALALAGTVTAARFTALSLASSFRLAADASNGQVLPNLSAADIVYVSAASGISEELLFRGALLPLLAPDWRGVVISGLLFGALHVNGGRNLAFAAWAGVVGGLYGAAFLATHDIWVPAVAHSLANVASAAIWLSRNPPEKP